MKFLALLACLLAAGAVASYAVATPPPGKGKPQSTTTTTTSTTSHGNGHTGKIVLCHTTGSKAHPYVKVAVSRNALKAHLKRGDVVPLADGSCPKPAVTTTTASATTTTTPAP